MQPEFLVLGTYSLSGGKVAKQLNVIVSNFELVSVNYTHGLGSQENKKIEGRNKVIRKT